MILLPIIVILTIYRKVIFTDSIFIHLDVVNNYFPYFNQLFNRTGSMQFGIIGGYPIDLSISTTWYSPISIFFSGFLDPFTAFRLMNVGFVIFAYIFTYILCRRMTVSKISSSIAGLIYVLSGQVILWSSTIIISVYYSLLPLIFLIIYLSFSKKIFYKWIFLTIAGVLLGLTWLVGHVQWAIFIHLAVSGYLLLVIYKKEKSFKDRFLELFYTASFIFLLSFIIGHPMIGAINDYAKYTARSGGVSLDMATYYAYYPYHLIHYLLPSFSVPYISFYQKAFPNYLGILPLIFLIFGFLNFKKINRQYPEAKTFLIIGLFCLLASIKYSPITFISHYLPFLKSIREAPRIMFIGDFAFAVYIAFIIDYIVVFKDEVKDILIKYSLYIKNFTLYIIAPFVLVFSIANIFFFSKIEGMLQGYFLKHVFSGVSGGFDKSYYFSLIHSYIVQILNLLSITNIEVITLLFGLISLYLLFKYFDKINAEKFLKLALIIISINFTLQYFNYFNVVSRDEYLKEPNTSIYIKEREKAKSDFRIFSPLNGTSIYTESIRCPFTTADHWEISNQDFTMRKELFEPNMNLNFGLDSADGYEPYMWSRVSDVLGYIGSRFASDDRTGLQLGNNTASSSEKIKEFINRKNFLRSLNIKYVASYYKIDDTDFKEIFVEDLGKCKTRIFLYELNSFWPRYFLADNVNILYGKNDKEVFEEYTNKIIKNDKPSIYVEDSSLDSNSKTNTKSSIEIVVARTSNDTISFDISTKSDKYLYIGNTWFPGWYAEIDGKEVKISIANYSNMVVFVPKGDHKIELKYKY